MEKESSDNIRTVRRITGLGMAVNLALAGLKAAVGLLCASHALVADALHSLSDLVTDCAVIFGVKYWEAPADEEHPYGHGKIQALVTLFIALMLLGVAWQLGAHAVAAFRAGRAAAPGLGAFLLALVAIAAKEILYRATARCARRIKSPALEANAWHHRSDALSSVPVALAVALAHFFPSLWWADAAGAFVVAVFIALMVWDLARSALQELTDAQIDAKSTDVARVACGVPGVRSVHCCRARRYGGAFQADLHIQVDPALSIVDAHRLGHQVKDAILAAGIDVVDAIIHVEPFDPARHGEICYNGGMKALFAIVSLLSAAACAGVRVPMDVRANGMHLVNGTLDGVPCRLLVDTGATHTTFDLGFVTNRFPSARLQEVKVVGETNVGFAPKYFSYASLRLGAHAFPAKGAMAVPLDGLHGSIGERIDGVLGMSDLATADFILRDRELEFTPSEAACAAFGPDRRAGGDAWNPEVVGRRGERAIRFLVDSGSSFTFVNAAVWKATTNTVGLAATEISGKSDLAPRLGEAGELDLGVTFTLRPMVSARPVNYLGADFLKTGEILFRARGGAIAFRRAGRARDGEKGHPAPQTRD